MTLGIAAEVCTDGSVRGSVRGIWYRTEVNLGTRYIPKYRTVPCGVCTVCTENRGVGSSVPPLYYVFPTVLWSAYPVASKSGVVGIRYT